MVAPSQQQHLTAAAVVKSGMHFHKWNNFTKMRRNSISRHSNNGDEEEGEDEEFALYCWTFKCNGNV
jgi:hypothetical protein